MKMSKGRRIFRKIYIIIISLAVAAVALLGMAVAERNTRRIGYGEEKPVWQEQAAPISALKSAAGKMTLVV